MKYTIATLEVKDLAGGKRKANVELTTPDGQPIPNVSIWSDFPGFDTLTFGSEVEGDVVPAKDPKWGPTLYPPKAPAGMVGGKGNIGRAMERKEQSIEKFQDNKEASIKISSTLRDAVTLAKVEVDAELFPATDLAVRIEHWRKWLLAHWDVRYDELSIPF